MTYKEDETQLTFNLNVKIFLSVLVQLITLAFLGYRLYLAGQANPSTVSRVVAPRLKVSNLEELSYTLKSTESGTKITPLSLTEPFN